MKTLLCIDDTDNLESIGTGEMLENLCHEMEKLKLAKTGYVTRHQLFLHEDIRYTSHNSAMCCELKIEEENLPEVKTFAGIYLEKNSAEGSDPGLCIVLHKRLNDAKELISFGKKAKAEVLCKADAYALAAKYPDIIHLSEHGGTGDGIIGALAGCGLRLWGSDGRVKGKIIPVNPDEIMTVKEFCKLHRLEKALDTNLNLICDSENMVCGPCFKAIMNDNQPTMILVEDEKNRAKWIPMDKKQLNKGGHGR